MPEFTYKAARRDGTLAQGSLTAPSQEAALRQLRSQGLTPVRVVTGSAAPMPSATGSVKGGVSGGGRATVGTTGGVKSSSGTMSTFLARRRSGAPVSRDDVLAITSELAVLLRAGLPIDRALKVQIDMSAKDSYTGLLQYLLDTVKGGKSFSHALQAHESLFGNFYINMVRSGEASGRLMDVLARLAEYLESAKAVRSTVVSALIYPAILATVAVLSVAVMLGFVVPQFESLFADMGDALPAMTRAVIAVGEAVKSWWWLMLLVGGVVVYALRNWLASPQGRAWKDRKLLALPVLGGVLFKYEVARFARTMGTLLGNGVPMLQALGIAEKTVENSLVRESFQVLTPAVKGGRRMSEVLQESGAFTPLVVQMVRVGEESGRLDEMMLELARVYDGEVQAGIKRGLTFLEPMLILGMGGIIAVIIISILMGILSVNDLAM